MKPVNLFFSALVYFIILFVDTVSVNADWEYVDSGVTTDLVNVDFTDELHGLAVGDSSTIIATADGGRTWHRQTCPVENIDLRKVCFINNHNGYIITGPKLISTKDGGETWNATDISSGFTCSDMSFIDENTGWISGYTSSRWGEIYHTVDGGETWEKLYDTSGNSPEIDLFDGIEFIDNNNGWVLGGPHFDNFDHTNVYRTFDGGKNWEKIAQISSPRQEIDVIPPDTLWVYNYGIARSFNGGVDWDTTYSVVSQISDEIYQFPGEYVKTCQATGLISWAIAGKVYREFDERIVINNAFSTITGGNTWTEELSDENTFFLGITNVGKNFVCIVGTDGLIVTYRENPVSVELSDVIVPNAFQICGNYPNPFNPTTTIEYGLQQDSQITLSIYNSSGQRVCVLKDEHQQADNYTATWDATGFPSGLYFCTLKADGFTQTRKMMLVK